MLKTVTRLPTMPQGPKLKRQDKAQVSNNQGKNTLLLRILIPNRNGIEIIFNPDWQGLEKIALSNDYRCCI